MSTATIDGQCRTCTLLARVAPCGGHDLEDLALACKTEDHNNWTRGGPYQVGALLDLMRAIRSALAGHVEQPRGDR